jgi:hypothetical protein
MYWKLVSSLQFNLFWSIHGLPNCLQVRNPDLGNFCLEMFFVFENLKTKIENQF